MVLYPVASEQPTMRPAVANLTIIALNVFIFLLEIILWQASFFSPGPNED